MAVISPVPLAQIVTGRTGRQYEVSGGAALIAQRLHDLDESLEVHFNDTGFFVVIQTIPEGPRKGEKDVVMRVPADEWDGRVVKEWEERAYEMRNGISPIDRLERLEQEARDAREYDLDQRTSEVAQRLFVSLQREVVGIKPRAFFPRAVAKAA